MERVQKSIAITGLIAAALGIALYSSTDSKPERSSEFLGISFEKDILKEIPICADEQDPDQLCLVSTSNQNKFEIRGLPYLPITPGYKVFATLEEDQLAELVLSGKTENYNMVRSMAEAYLGEPTEEIENWLTNSRRGAYLHVTSLWKTESKIINLQREKDDLGKYSMSISRVDKPRLSEETISSSQ